MAGIGFELRKLLQNRTFLGQVRAYGIGGIISSGPWVLSILGIMVIGMLNRETSEEQLSSAQFQVSVTYLMAGSLILTGPLQLLFTRFVSDRIYEKREALILPNLLGAIVVTTLTAGLLGIGLLLLLFSESLIYEICMLASFVALSNMWIVSVLLAALKRWGFVFLVFLIGYSALVGVSFQLRTFGLEGLMVGFTVGHAVMFFLLLGRVLRSFPGEKLVAFDFLDRRQIFFSLAVTGLIYNLGIWADKFIFWFNPLTGENVIGPLRVSQIYDLPIFLAYLSIVPGLTVFLIKMETDFSEKCRDYFLAVNSGKTLDDISRLKSDMVTALQKGLFDIFKVQGLTILILMAVGDKLLAWLGISPLYRVLFNVNLVAVAVQLLVMIVLNVLFYFDQRRVGLQLSVLFFFLNVLLTLLSQYMGPAFYGYGFAAAALLTSFVGLIVLSLKLENLEYETFMLRPISL